MLLFVIIKITKLTFLELKLCSFNMVLNYVLLEKKEVKKLDIRLN